MWASKAGQTVRSAADGADLRKDLFTAGLLASSTDSHETFYRRESSEYTDKKYVAQSYFDADPDGYVTDEQVPENVKRLLDA